MGSGHARAAVRSPRDRRPISRQRLPSRLVSMDTESDLPARHRRWLLRTLLAGLLISADIAGLGWRAVFLVNVPVGATALVATTLLPATGRRRAWLELAGVALLSLTVLFIVLPLTLGRSQGWPAWSWACLAASTPAGAAFALLAALTGGLAARREPESLLPGRRASHTARAVRAARQEAPVPERVL